MGRDDHLSSLEWALDENGDAFHFSIYSMLLITFDYDCKHRADSRRRARATLREACLSPFDFTYALAGRLDLN